MLQPIITKDVNPYASLCKGSSRVLKNVRSRAVSHNQTEHEMAVAFAEPDEDKPLPLWARLLCGGSEAARSAIRSSEWRAKKPGLGGKVANGTVPTAWDSPARMHARVGAELATGGKTHVDHGGRSVSIAELKSKPLPTLRPKSSQSTGNLPSAASSTSSGSPTKSISSLSREGTSREKRKPLAPIHEGVELGKQPVAGPAHKDVKEPKEAKLAPSPPTPPAEVEKKKSFFKKLKDLMPGSSSGSSSTASSPSTETAGVPWDAGAATNAKGSKGVAKRTA